MSERRWRFLQLGITAGVLALIVASLTPTLLSSLAAQDKWAQEHPGEPLCNCVPPQLLQMLLIPLLIMGVVMAALYLIFPDAGEAAWGHRPATPP